MDSFSHFVDGKWQAGLGPPIESADPATGEPVWRGHSAVSEEIDRAVISARRAFKVWSRTPLSDRIEYLHHFRRGLVTKQEHFAHQISLDTGKPLWESRTEVEAMRKKIELSVEAYEVRRHQQSYLFDGVQGTTRYKPHGAVAVLGPFNLPGHLPNAHIVPALLAGNTIVFKPSENALGVAHELGLLWESAGLPDGVVNILSGDHTTGRLLACHSDIAGVYFTGGYDVGRAIHRQFADHPEKILALELGGNNPLGVFQVANKKAAAYWTIYSAFITSGQRCTCARRLIVPLGPDGDAFLDEVKSQAEALRVGACTSDPEPFMGPVITPRSADRMLTAQAELLHRGAHCMLKMDLLPETDAMLSPGLIDVTAVSDRPDKELFGPLLQVIRVPDFDALLVEANNTSFGLSAGLFSDDQECFHRFYHEIQAGIVNWNRPLTGASGKLPFGGVGQSGNHRPSGYFATDYCSFPVASLESEGLSLPPQLSPGITV